MDDYALNRCVLCKDEASTSANPLIFAATAPLKRSIIRMRAMMSVARLNLEIA
jgi:hypothetical protein